MSITPPTGILDITDAIVRVSKLEFRGATGFDTILNNVARNTILLVDQNVEYTTDKAWGLKLPNAWVSEFDAYWASGASGNIDFNIYNNTTSGTNGYVISMDDTTITVTYDGGSALKTVSLGSTLKNDTWRKIHILFERDMISLAIDGTPVLYFKDTLLRPRVYDEESGYVVAAGLSANRKVKNLRILNGDKWMTDNTSNIAFVHGNVGIGTTQAAYTLDVKGDIRATGNLLIEGLTTTVDTQNLSIEDAIVEIGRGNDGGTSGKDVGFLFTRNNGTNTTNSNVALIYDESTDRLTFGYSDGSPTDSTLAINTSKSLDVVIPSGNLGIGTASPAYKLDVAGTGNFTGTVTAPTFSGGTVTVNNSLDGTMLIAGNGLNYNSYLDLRAIARSQTLGQTGGWYRLISHGSIGRNGVFAIQQMAIDGASVQGERLTINGSGNVGIGTTSPLSTFQIGYNTDNVYNNNPLDDNTISVFGKGVTPTIAANGDMNATLFLSTNDAFAENKGSSIALAARHYNFGGGNQHLTCARISGVASGGFSGDFVVETQNGGSLYERLRILPNGNVGIGTASPNTQLHLHQSASTYVLVGEGNMQIYNDSTSAGYEYIILNNSTTGSHTTTYMHFRRNGTAYGSITGNGTNVFYNTSSDYRLKENIIPMSSAASVINNLKPVSYTFKSNPDNINYGFIAHEVSDAGCDFAVQGTKDQMQSIGNIVNSDNEIIKENVIEPDTLKENETWVKTGERPEYQQLDVSKLIPHLTCAFQELYSELQDTKTQLASVLARLDALESA
jgi:hypothetical protein